MNFSHRAAFPDGPNSLERTRRTLQASGRPIFNLSQSNPTQTGLFFPSEVLADALAAGSARAYCPDPHGLAAAREAIAEHFADSGLCLDPDRFFLCASTSEAYSYLFKLLCDPGDSVFVPQPGYPLFDNLAQLESVRAVGYDLAYEHPYGWTIDIDALRAQLESGESGRAKAIVLINPNNPTGSYVTEGELAGIVALCKEHSLALIADQVFFDYPLDSRGAPVNFYGFDEVLTFVLDGFSKRLCLPQVKLGWTYVSGPEAEVRAAVGKLEIIADTFLSAGTPIMAAAVELLRREEEIQQLTRARMAEVMDVYRLELEGADSPHRILRCEGGWTALVQSPALDEEEALAVDLLRRTGLYIHPGFFFDMRGGVFFAFSLIIRPEDAQRAARAYADYFAQIGN